MVQRVVCLLIIPALPFLSQARQSLPGLTISHLYGDFYVYITYNVYNGTTFPANGMYMVTSKGIV